MRLIVNMPMGRGWQSEVPRRESRERTESRFSVHESCRRAFYESPGLGAGEGGSRCGGGEAGAAGRTRLHRSGRVVLFAMRSAGIGGGARYRVPDADARCQARAVQGRRGRALIAVTAVPRRSPSVLRSIVHEWRPLFSRPERNFSRSVPYQPSALFVSRNCYGRRHRRGRKEGTNGQWDFSSRVSRRDGYELPGPWRASGVCYVREGDLAARPNRASLKRRETRSVLRQRGAI